MRRRIPLLFLAVIVLAAGGYAIWRLTRPPQSDQQQIRNLILKAARALEQRRVQTFMKLVADDYNDGTHTKRDIESLARGAVLQAGEIRVVPYLRSLEVQGMTATAVVQAEVTVGRDTPGANLGEPAQGRYTVEMVLAKGPHGWQVTSAQGWEEAQAELMNDER
jgi:hypothetical protein